MEQVIRRTVQAKAQAARRLARLKEKRAKVEKRQEILNANSRLVHIAKEKTRVRDELTEDRLLGPLAPQRGMDKVERQQRDVLPDTSFGEGYKTVLEDQRIKFWNIVPGDRVVILTGKDRNKVGVVQSLEKSCNSLIVKGLNMYPLRTPPFLEPGKPGVPSIMDREFPLPYGQVRLVHPVIDPQTSIFRDAIVKKIKMSKPYFDKHTKRIHWRRYIPYLNIHIPWPVNPEPKEQTEYEIDTRRMNVEDKTYIPSLFMRPFPDTVIDELRGKYSKFRDRHEKEYIEAKTKADEEKKKFSQIKVATPLKEINRRIRFEKKELGKTQKLTDDILEKIGRSMVKSMEGEQALAEQRANKTVADGIREGFIMPPPRPPNPQAVIPTTVS